MAEFKGDFSGFANAPVDEDSGERLDFRDVPGYDDQTEDGKTRKESQETQSDVVKFATDDTSTDGAPAAVVPGKRAGGKGAAKS